jgi:hypothetical protein
MLVLFPAYWQAYQHATGFYVTANSTRTSEIPEVIRVHVTSQVKDATPEELAEEGFKVVNDLNAKHLKYIRLVEELQTLSTALESEKFTFKSIRSFPDKPLVAASVALIEELFPAIDTGPGTKSTTDVS